MEEQLQLLKGICTLLGIDTNPNGLTECALAKSYLQRIIKFLGG